MTFAEVIHMDKLLFSLMWYHIIHKQHCYYAYTHDYCEHTNFDDPVGFSVFQWVSGKKIDRA